MPLGRMLIGIGLLLVLAGVLVSFSGRLPFRLGRLPGDIYYHGKHTTVYFPLGTCVLLSAAFSVVLWLLRK